MSYCAVFRRESGEYFNVFFDEQPTSQELLTAIDERIEHTGRDTRGNETHDVPTVMNMFELKDE